MNEKQILKEIAYYSKLIDTHKKRTEQEQFTNNDYKYKPYDFYNTNKVSYNQTMNPTNAYNPNKYKYIKKPQTVIIPIEKKVSTKVLINPNFKGSVHINPRFNPAKKNPQNIHVNPKIINVSSTINFKIDRKLSAPSNIPHEFAKPVNNLQFKTPVRKRRVSIRSKYKIVKSGSKSPNSPLNRTIVKNKYKIDRRSKTVYIKSQIKRRLIKRSISDNLRTSLFKNKTWRRNSLVTDQFKLNNSTKNRSKVIKPKNVNNKLKRCFISLRGQKYVMDSTKKTLKLLPNSPKPLSKPVKKVSVKGVTYVQKSAYTYVKSISATNLSISRSRKNSFRGYEISSFRKNNIPCPVYHRFGKCRRKDAGRCTFKHNPEQIALCKKFLQGACIDEECLLSHKVSLEKMPTCKYYLEGCCVRAECSYLHVKISPNAEICKNFLEGFCKDAVKCDKRHQYLCPDFERFGKCPKRKCRYPHKSKCTKEKKVSKQEKLDKRLNIIQNKVEVEAARYYFDKGEVEKDNIGQKVSDTDILDFENEDIYKRVKLGILPSFIPLD